MAHVGSTCLDPYLNAFRKAMLAQAFEILEKKCIFNRLVKFTATLLATNG